MKGNKQEVHGWCKDEKNAGTSCNRVLDATLCSAHEIEEDGGQSRSEGDGSRREGEEFGITEKDSGGCAICRSRIR